MGDDVLERRSRELVAAVGGLAGEAIDRLEEQGLATRPQRGRRFGLDDFRGRDRLEDDLPLRWIEACIGEQTLVAQPREEPLVRPAGMCGRVRRNDSEVSVRTRAAALRDAPRRSRSRSTGCRRGRCARPDTAARPSVVVSAVGSAISTRQPARSKSRRYSRNSGYRYCSCGSSSTIATVRSGCWPRARAHSSRKLSTMRVPSWPSSTLAEASFGKGADRQSQLAVAARASSTAHQQSTGVGVDLDELWGSVRRGGNRTRVRHPSWAGASARSRVPPVPPWQGKRRSRARG